jgi:enterobactin synthetase component F
MPLALPTDLTPFQAAIWVDQQLHAGKPIYNTGQVLTIRGNLRIDLFEIALRETIAECPSLRLPMRPHPAPFDLVLLDFRQKEDPLALAQQWMRAEMRRAISLKDPALFRFALIQISDDYTLWFMKTHHIIIDATGRRLFSARTAERYRALRFNEPLSVLNATTPEELLDAERCYAASNSHAADRNYWLEQFTRWPEPLLEINRQNTERFRSGCNARIAFTLKRADFERLETAARTLESSAPRMITALAYAAFARLYDRYDIVLGVELAHRADARSKQVIGLMARPLPMLLTLNRTTTIADVVRRVDEARTRNYPHRHFAIHELVRESALTRKGHYGLFDVIINYMPLPYDFAFEALPVEHINLSNGFTAPWLVTIIDSGLTRDLDVTIDTDPGLIPAEKAAQLASCMETLLLRGMDDPTCPLGSLPIMPETTRAQVLGFAASEAVALPEGATVATLCAAQAERTPDAIALISDEQQLSFATLHGQAELLARRLAALGVRPGVVVGIALPRAPILVVAVLAVHKAGGAYLALDPSYPADRIRFMVADAAAPIILTDATLTSVFADSGARLIFVGEPTAEDAAMVEPVAAGPSDLAYVLYTSGSTGRPKAVGIEHRNLINLISWGRSIVSDAELRGLLFSTSLNFDLSAFEMFLPLAFGGCMILVENLLALASVPQRELVRLVNTGPSLFEMLLRMSGLPPGVTTVILAGEKLSRRLATSVFDANPGVRLLNCYGPTETTVYSSWSLVEPAAQTEPTIGRAISNTNLYVLDNGCALLPPAIEGELFIGGAGVARGYLGRSELTAERFLTNPYGPGRIYRTGDRVRWRVDGELEFLGRIDDQMKINGIRVEPGEIEAALMALPEISAAVVALYEDEAGVRRLAAYLVPLSGVAPATEKVRAALALQLPRNMVPSRFIWLDALPMTPNGKIDRKALPTPPPEEVHASANHPPETNLERELAEIWEELLGVSPIGVRSDFSDLGGDSLSLVSLFATIEARYGRRLTVDVLPGGLTIAGLAQLLTGGAPQGEELDPVVALQPHGQRPPFFCVHGIGGDVLHLHRLAVHMGPDRPFFGLRRTAEAPLTDSINQMAARYVAAMLDHQPTGPFYLGGHSFGAMIAYEMAQQLVAQGHEIGLLAIIDQRRPGWRLTARHALPVLHRILSKLPGRLRDDLVRAPTTDRLRYVRRRLLGWAKVVWNVRPNVAGLFDLDHGETEQILLHEAHMRALRNYRPVSTSVPITLFRAEVQFLSHLVLDATLGWKDLAQREVRVHVVPGSHGSMAREPFVPHLARVLSDELDAAQGISRDAKPTDKPKLDVGVVRPH